MLLCVSCDTSGGPAGRAQATQTAYACPWQSSRRASGAQPHSRPARLIDLYPAPRSHEELTDHDLKWATRMTCGYW